MQAPSRRTADECDQRAFRKPRDLTDGRDLDFAQPPCGHLPHAPEPFDGKRVQEGELTVRWHREQPVRLRHPARHLGQELRAGDPDGDRQSHPLAHLAPQLHGDLGGRSREPLEPADVQERLVDRQSLDERRRVVEHPVDLLARLRVRRHARTNDDRVGAEPARKREAHRRVHAVRLRLVAGRKDDPAADDHGPSAQPGVIPLLDRREERVDVGVQDRRLVLHEHMFA